MQNYEYIGSYTTMNFYKNKNLEAIDLNTDPELKKSLLLKRQSLPLFIVLLIVSLILVITTTPSLFETLSNKAIFYLNFERFCRSIGIFLFIPISLFALYSSNKKTHAIKNDTYNYKNFKTHDLILHAILGLLSLHIFGFALLVSDSLIEFLAMTEASLVYIIMYAIHHKFIQPKGEYGQRKVREIILFASIFIALTAFDEIIFNQTTTLPNNFPIEDTMDVLFIKERTPLYYRIDTHQENKTTTYFECRNEEIANTLYQHFKQLNEHSNTKEKYIFKEKKLIIILSNYPQEDVKKSIEAYTNFYTYNPYF